MTNSNYATTLRCSETDVGQGPEKTNVDVQNIAHKTNHAHRTIDLRRGPLHKFEYRSPRFDVPTPHSLLLNLSLEGLGNVDACCTTIGYDGMSIECGHILGVGTIVEFHLSAGQVLLKGSARVLYRLGSRHGLEFLFDSDLQQTRLKQLVTTIMREAEALSR